MTEGLGAKITPPHIPEAGTPEAAIIVDRWWDRFGPTKGKLNIFDREENDQLDKLEAVPAELDDYYDGIFRRHLADVQDLMLENGIDFVSKSKFAEQDALRRAGIEIQGYTDQLTGLKNRRWLEETIDSQVETSHQDPNSNLWAVFIDLDRFKYINTIYNHTGGDNLLRLMGNLARNDELISRFGGEEFVQLINLNNVRIEEKPEATDEEKIASITGRYSRLYKEMSAKALQEMHPKDTLKDNEISEEGIPKVVTLSFGATKLQPGENGLQLLSRASAAVAEAKNAGRDTTFIAVPDQDRFSFQQLQQVA